MKFYRVRFVKHPRKRYVCYICKKQITGEHKYISAVSDGEFHTARVHIECLGEMSEICSECEYINDCQGDMGECFSEGKLRGNR